jgi:phage shock protein PspC (stress-responsive transcriptional regulator)
MQQPSPQSFYRGNDRIVGGVCSGLAEGFHVEALWVRLAFVILAFVQGIGVVLYVVLWVLMPERTGHRPTGQTNFQSMRNDIMRAWADLRSQFWGSPTTSTASTTTGEAIPPMPSGSATQPASRNPSFILGVILIVIGIAFLIVNTNMVNLSIVLPAVLVVLGIALLVRNLQRSP